MTSLIACLSTGKGSWIEVKKLISSGMFEKTFLVTNDFGREKFQTDDKTELIVIDNQADTQEIIKGIVAGLGSKLSGEVALNMTSGSGKEHMALLSAIMKLGLGFRLVEPGEQGGVKEI
ncbi:MAG: hypothetical protein V1659_03845 [Candidatus Woesearchaeota archaeon]